MCSSPLGRRKCWPYPDTLILHVHAEDAERLQIAKHVVGGHLKEFAYRGEPITVTWADVATD